ncbi:hypothetical protein [Bradyrhizobium diversitatis]|uniref:hypothetical protein n=1 Tax=Bradyrhizobium diversitatis TaxID=2755406 RepID=UPI001FED2762|nr:hypothetical protein [Bradyrhizobium diversitatis]
MKFTHANDATVGRLQIGIPGRLRIGMHGRLRRNPQLNRKKMAKHFDVEVADGYLSWPSRGINDSRPIAGMSACVRILGW